MREKKQHEGDAIFGTRFKDNGSDSEGCNEVSVPFDTLVGELDRVFWTQSHAGMFGDDINTMLLVKEEWLDEHYQY
jgi:hypothetical protein